MMAAEAAAPVVVLIRPQLAENIGAAARAMMNTGLSELRLVRPRDGWPNADAWPMASGAEAILMQAKVFDSLPEALADLQRLFATTARDRDMVKRIVTPRQAAGDLRAAGARGERTGLLFGSERSGMTSDELALAETLVMVPLNPEHPSLNLAQAVLLLGYEWWLAADETPPSRVHLSGSTPVPRRLLIDFLDRLEAALDEDGYFRTPEQKPAMLRNLKAFFARAEPTEQEVRTLHGVVAALRGARLKR
ncbi:MAG: RNA methyltransferase [Rhodospirillales bacterium]